MTTVSSFCSSGKPPQTHDTMAFPPNFALTRPESYSDTTEIIDTDFDSDSLEAYSDDYSRKSVRSLGTESVTTASTPDDVKTPDSTGLTAFHFHIDESPVKGPVGPHLFRLSGDSSEMKASLGVNLVAEDYPTSAMAPLYSFASKFDSGRMDAPVPDNTNAQQNVKTHAKKMTVNKSTSGPSESDVSSWSPEDVVMWMQNKGFDDSIIERFFVNDISGSILLELQADDLKELDIQSFGKRHRLMGCIRQLRDTASSTCGSQSSLDPTSREDTSTPHTTAADVGVTECTSPTTEEKPRTASGQRRRRHRHKRRHGTDLVPEDSVSIVAIEQLLPKLHTCSKGENCRKWQKQQAKLARLAKDVPVECLGGSVRITGDPGNAATAQTIVKTPKSEVTPSVIASSDALGQNQNPEVQLSQEKLNDVQPRDPQENVRNFLNFQRLSRLQPVTDPATPPKEHFSPSSDSPGSTKGNATLSENLRHLPKLRIPSTHSDVTSSTLSPNYSAQRTITPSILGRKQPFSQYNVPKSPKPYSSMESPADFYRQDPHYGQTTPFSEVDVPITAIPLGPVARMCSQSVPPDMRFGGHYARQVADPIPRPASTKNENSRRNAIHLDPQTSGPMHPLEEREPLPPIETPEDMARTPRAAHCRNNPFIPGGRYANDIIHSGWMKKRRTTRLLRHEWEEHHFALRGTRLAMYSDEEASQRNSKALEYIDVDDYAVACSSLPSNSKLTAAFKKTVLKRKDNSQGEAAFAFSLIPSPTNSGFDKKTLFANGLKSHHFAVKTRDERIDWMRELMLAKALRKGRESGASVNVNGTAL
ncbi:hypothetical protein BDV27DRAFT_102958 [Aspergillus caelatus]|uniref:SAM and PH domain protein n=1 Tax=Aspergillus caelatus TaxID=61420 RepID=A0A5N7A6H1_9EURO|nr:uncharacterized protein BDV27DRAFT_102958 [Aspergillus caelatus]KAE8365454.1 hypothetical protein BDV27DRAFT_102958 [Aspergillus caelatus]